MAARMLPRPLPPLPAAMVRYCQCRPRRHLRHGARATTINAPAAPWRCPQRTLHMELRVAHAGVVIAYVPGSSRAQRNTITQTHARSRHATPGVCRGRSVGGRYPTDAALPLRVSHVARTCAPYSQERKGVRRGRGEFAASPHVRSMLRSPHVAFDDRVVVHVGLINVPLTARRAHPVQW